MLPSASALALQRLDFVALVATLLTVPMLLHAHASQRRRWASPAGAFFCVPR